MTRNNVRMRVVRSMQRRSLRRLTPPTHQMNFGASLAKLSTFITFNLATLCLFLPMQLPHACMYLDVLRGAHTDIESKDECDIEDL